MPCQGGRSWQMRHRRWRVIRCLPALSEWPPKGLRLSGRPEPPARVRVAGAAARCALAFGIQVADPLRGGRLRWLVRRWLVLQQATRFEAELFRHANISGRKPAASRCFRPCLVQRYLLRHRRTRASLNAKRRACTGWMDGDAANAAPLSHSADERDAAATAPQAAASSSRAALIRGGAGGPLEPISWVSLRPMRARSR